MSQARVFVNGKEAGFWPNGYNTFYFDITDLLNKDGKNNTLAVRLENNEEQSRWYPGAGLYRNVHLIVTNKTHIPVWGTYVTTPVVEKSFARVNVRTKVENREKDEGIVKKVLQLKTTILDPENNEVASQTSDLTKFDGNEFNQTLIVENPKLWTLDDPNLYQVKSILFVKRLKKKSKETKQLHKNLLIISMTIPLLLASVPSK